MSKILPKKTAVGVKPTPGTLRTKAICSETIIGFAAPHKKGPTITKPDANAIAQFINAQRQALGWKCTLRVTQHEHVFLAMHPENH